MHHQIPLPYPIMKKITLLFLSILALSLSSCNKVCQVACFDDLEQEYTTKIFNVKCSSVKNFVFSHGFAKYDVYEVINGVRVYKNYYIIDEENDK